MVLCDNCGYDNKKTAKFCHSCGAKIEDIEIEPKPTHDIDLGKLSLGNIFSKKQPEPEFPTSFSYRGMNRYKSEGTTLALSLFIGLLGIMGVGHRYVGNVIRSLCILGIGYGVGFLWFSHLFMLILASQSTYGMQSYAWLHPLAQAFVWVIQTPETQNFLWVLIGFTIAVPVGYYTFLTWQIFDARKQCRKFNLHMDEVGRQFWEVTKQWKILYRIGLISPILAGIVFWFVGEITSLLSNLFYNLFG